MTDIRNVFSEKALITFITVGDPDIETSEELVVTMAEAGADLIELGIPFSDPIAEGPVIQAADVRALGNGVTTDDVFDMAERIRDVRGCNVPLAVMTYMNPVFVYGAERFVNRCRDAGICAIIVPDLPYEEKGCLLPQCRVAGVDLISMIAPTSKDRISTIASEAEGFLYVVSSMGVTGMRRSLGDHVAEMVGSVREVSDIPCAVGFGISTPEQARDMVAVSDGAIVGSAIVDIIAEHGRGSAPYVRDMVRAMKSAVSGARHTPMPSATAMPAGQ